jgi:hypothetical protein
MPTVFTPLIGRTGNLLFIYAYAKAWAEQNGYEVSTYPWYGEQVFNIPKAPRPDEYKPDIVWPEAMHQEQDDLIYTRRQVRGWFAFQPHVVERLSVMKPVELLFSCRQGEDVRRAGLVTLSCDCYAEAARKAGYDPHSAEWELDTNPTRLPSFGGTPGVKNLEDCGCGLGTNAVSIPAMWRMMSAKVLFRANSTFDWWAATLGDCKVYAPVIRGLEGGVPNVFCDRFVQGNWPAASAAHTDWHLAETVIPDIKTHE